MKTLAVLTTVLLLGLATPATASERATTVGAPDGSTLYLYAYPHGLELWQESNGVGADCGAIPEGLPIGHVTQPEDTMTGLQREAGACNGISYAADTKLA